MNPNAPGGEGTRDGGNAVVPGIAYPLLYTFKVMGLASDDFAEHARRLVESALGPGDAPAERVRIRSSAGGKYHSISVVAWLVSEEQRKAVYGALCADRRVVYYL